MKFDFRTVASAAARIRPVRRSSIPCPVFGRTVATTSGRWTAHRPDENPTPCRFYASGSGQPPTSPTPTSIPPLTSTPPPTLPPPVDEDGGSQNIFQRFKTMAKKYWYIVLPVHVVTSTLWFGSFYFVASSGVDVPALLESLRFPEWIIDKVKNGNSWTSYLVIAYGLYKIFTPLRYMVTLGGTSITIRYLQRLGYAVGVGFPKKP